MRALDNTESDLEAHKLYNILGHAYYQEHKYRLSLHAHRQEKRICKELLSSEPSNTTYLRDLAIAYRQCGNVMLRVQRLKSPDGVIIEEREHVILQACKQHEQSLSISKQVEKPELQKSYAACAQGTLALALETKSAVDFEKAAEYSFHAGKLAKSFTQADGVTEHEKLVMILGASHNMAIALSGLGKREMAKQLLYAVAIKARSIDESSFVRAIANLAEEAGDEEDWELCEVFVKEWARVAKKTDDVSDESDALRKLAVALREKRDYDGATKALRRALSICPTKAGKAEAKRFLTVIEQDIEEEQQWETEMNEHVLKAETYMNNGNYVEEAKLRLQAGNCAFNLHRSQKVVDHLGRYFELVDEYGCNTAVTEVAESVHNSAVANMGEAMWKMKRYEEAVKWAIRELSTFDGDMAGQAQAWCNLGVYLDDLGRKEKAIDALRKSMQLAEQSGELELLMRAKNNLEVVEQMQAALTSQLGDGDDHEADNMEGITSPRPQHGDGKQHVVETRSGDDCAVARDPTPTNSNSKPQPFGPSNEPKQVTVMSSQVRQQRENRTVTACSQDVSARNSRFPPVDMRGCPSTAHSVQDHASAANNSRSYQSLGANTADRSSRGVRNVLDLASEYKQICNKRQPPVRIRGMVVDALKALSSTLIARDACDEPAIGPVTFNVSLLLLNGKDVSAMFETLTRVGNNHELLVDMSRNPLIPPIAFDCLQSKFTSTLPPLLGIKQLDLSCAGLSGNSLRLLAGALSEKGSLSCVSVLKVGKNALGRDGKLTSFAVAQVLTHAGNLAVLDLSLNLLSNTFMEQLVEELQKSKKQLRNGACIGTIRSIDLHLNNRCQPSALLESNATDYMVSHFEMLFKLLPCLESIDVRACGGSVEMRKSLRELSRRFDSFSKNIITVSESIDDG